MANFALNLTVNCICGAEVAILQENADDLSELTVIPCSNCIKTKVIEILRSKKTEFDSTYDNVESAAEEVLRIKS